MHIQHKQAVVVVWLGDRTTRRPPGEKRADRGPARTKCTVQRFCSLQKPLPPSFPKILSCGEICCVHAFHVSEKKAPVMTAALFEVWRWQDVYACVPGCVFYTCAQLFAGVTQGLSWINNSRAGITVTQLRHVLYLKTVTIPWPRLCCHPSVCARLAGLIHSQIKGKQWAS